MIASLLIHTVTGKRPSIASQDTIGEPVATLANVTDGAVTDLPCRVEESGELTQYRGSNTRVKNGTLIYFPITTIIKVKDRLYWGTKTRAGVTTGDYIGIVSGVNPGLKGKSQVLDHWEVEVENP